MVCFLGGQGSAVCYMPTSSSGYDKIVQMTVIHTCNATVCGHNKLVLGSVLAYVRVTYVR